MIEESRVTSFHYRYIYNTKKTQNSFSSIIFAFPQTLPLPPSHEPLLAAAPSAGLILILIRSAPQLDSLSSSDSSFQSTLTFTFASLNLFSLHSQRVQHAIRARGVRQNFRPILELLGSSFDYVTG